MSTKIRGYAAMKQGQPLQPYEYEPGPLGDEQVEIKVETCGICHSDLSMLDNEWGMTTYPIIPGHEVIGTVAAAGPATKRVKVGDRVGLGWNSSSCLACPSCLSGDHNLCVNVEGTIVGRPGGFAERVRCHWIWATPIPPGVAPVSAGPLLCGGITVFNPIIQFRVRPTERVGVVGIGGLGHLAVQFLNKWGCEVTAFTSSEGKRDEATRLGAHHVVGSRDSAALKAMAGTLDFLLVTVNAPLDWQAMIKSLAAKGRLHFVGAVLEPVPVAAFGLISGQKSVSGSPTGSPSTVDRMLAFCARHQIAPMIERFPMSKVNDALDHLRSGKARYRVVLERE